MNWYILAPPGIARSRLSGFSFCRHSSTLPLRETSRAFKELLHVSQKLAPPVWWNVSCPGHDNTNHSPSRCPILQAGTQRRGNTLVSRHQRATQLQPPSCGAVPCMLEKAQGQPPPLKCQPLPNLPPLPRIAQLLGPAVGTRPGLTLRQQRCGSSSQQRSFS